MVANHNPLPSPQPEALTKPAVCRALAILLEGYAYAADLQAPAWDFAVELETLPTEMTSPRTRTISLNAGFADCAASIRSCSSATVAVREHTDC